MAVHFPPELQIDDILLKIRNAHSNKNVVNLKFRMIVTDVAVENEGTEN